MIDDTIRKHHLESRVILQSFDFRTLCAMKKIDPHSGSPLSSARQSTTVSWESPTPTRASPTSPRAAGLRKDDFLSPDESLVTPEQVAAAHHAGLKVVPYTSNDAAGGKKLADAHVDAIITDDPAGLLPWLRSQQPPLHP
jgi:glycerophosphoryl diester phosphodiesterase